MQPSDGLQSRLRNLLLEAFADGEEVSGTWKAETVPESLPDWRVVVERIDSSESDRSVSHDSSADDPNEEDSL